MGSDVQFTLPKAPSTQYTSVTHSEDPADVPAPVKSLIERANTYVLPVYARPPFVLTHGKGAYVWDTEGRKYLDFSAGIAVNALGHADEGVAQVSAFIEPVPPCGSLSRGHTRL